MIKRFLLSMMSLVLFAGSSLFSADFDRDLFQSMVSLDKSYIPALALTGKDGENQGKVRNAVRRFVSDWRSFKTDNPVALPGWEKTSSDIDLASEKALKAVLESSPKKAHEALEAVRESLLSFRRSNGLDYYLDDFTVYHTDMEKLIDSLSLKNTNILPALDKAIASWNIVEKNAGKAVPFGLDEKKTGSLNDLILRERSALTRMKESLARSDAKSLAASAKELKPVFTRAFFLFGDFSKSEQ